MGPLAGHLKKGNRKKGEQNRLRNKRGNSMQYAVPIFAERNKRFLSRIGCESVRSGGSAASLLSLRIPLGCNKVYKGMVVDNGSQSQCYKVP